MKSPKMIAAALVSACVCVPSRFVNADSPQDHLSQKRPLRIASNDAWDDDDDDDDDEGQHQRNQYRYLGDNRWAGHRDDFPEPAVDDQFAEGHGDVLHGQRRLGNQRFEAQRRHQESELERQLDRAARLRQINQQTGNPQLIEIADRMEQRALEHYKQQLDRIHQEESRAQPTATLATEEPPVPTDDGPLVSILKSKPTAVNSPQPAPISSTQPPIAPTPQPSANPARISDHVQRQLVNEQKLLQQRLEAADRLRQLGSGPNGNERLLETADRMEQRAWEQFEQRVQPLIEPPRNQHRHYGQHYTTDDVDHAPDELERDVEKVEYRVPERPVRRVIKGLRHAIGR